MEDALRIYELSESDDIQSGDVLLIDNSSLEQARKITPEVIVSKYAPTKEALETEIANREAADAALGESIDTKIAEAKSIIPVKHIVQTLPTENINTRDTYLVPAEEPNENNLYIEYAYINGAWEIIGSPVNIDLSGYYTKTETDNLLDDKANASEIDTLEGAISAETQARESAIAGLQTSKAEAVDLTEEASTRAAADEAMAEDITSINSTLTTHGNSISTLQSDVSTAETNIENLQEDITTKADKPTITTPTGTSAELADNTEARFGEVASLTLTLPTDTTGEFGGYISSVVVTSGATATSLTYPDTITMIGTDCIDGVFAPVASKRYTVIVAYDGAGLVGYVAGHEVTA